MYNAHRGTGGIGPSNANSSNNRLSDLFDQIRREFEVHAQDRAGEHDQNSTFVDFSKPFARAYSLPKSAPVLLYCYYESCNKSSNTVALSES